MQLKRLRIDNYRCLVGFDIEFVTVSGGSSTILIGENGTGKPTMIPLFIFCQFFVGKIHLKRII